MPSVELIPVVDLLEYVHISMQTYRLDCAVSQLCMERIFEVDRRARGWVEYPNDRWNEIYTSIEVPVDSLRFPVFEKMKFISR